MSGLVSSCRFATALLALAAPAAAVAQVAPAQNASGRVELLQGLSLTRKGDLEFGDLVVAGAGTAVMNPVNGALTTTGAVSRLGSAARPAVFTGYGSRNSVVIIRIPKDPIVVTRSGGTETMTVSDWTLDGAKTRKVPPGSAFDFAVGATLSVAAGQAEGTYAGTFNVEIQYP